MSRVLGIAVLTVTLLVAILLGAANLYYGELNQDEGWYLYAAGHVTRGNQPYKDFAFTQAPVLPYVYTIAWPLVEKYGLAGGRFFTALLGLVSALLAAAVAGRLVPAEKRNVATVVALSLILVNVYQSYFTTVVKTYSLCAVFFIGGLLLFMTSTEKKSAVFAFLSAMLLLLAAGTRISAGVALPVIFVYLFLTRSAFRSGWLAFAAGAALAAIPVFLRWFLTAQEGFLFGVLEYHAARSAGDLAHALVYKAGFVSRVVQAYFVAISLNLALILWRLLKGPESATSEATNTTKILWTVVVAITLVHFSAPFPYDDYQALVYPLYGALLAAALVRRIAAHSLTTSPALGWLAASVLAVSLAASISSPINQSWFVRGRDRIWWRLREKPPLVKLQEAAAWIRQNSRPGDRLLTQDAYLAVEAGRVVDPGLEMGPFSYYPDMPWGRGKKLHVMNRDRMYALIHTTRAPIAAVSGYGFAVRSPLVEECIAEERASFMGQIEERYDLAKEIPDFGQGDTTLRLYKKKLRK